MHTLLILAAPFASAWYAFMLATNPSASLALQTYGEAPLIIVAPFASLALIAWLWPPKGKREGSFWTEGDED